MSSNTQKSTSHEAVRPPKTDLWITTSGKTTVKNRSLHTSKTCESAKRAGNLRRATTTEASLAELCGKCLMREAREELGKAPAADVYERRKRPVWYTGESARRAETYHTEEDCFALAQAAAPTQITLGYAQQSGLEECDHCRVELNFNQLTQFADRLGIDPEELKNRE